MWSLPAPVVLTFTRHLVACRVPLVLLGGLLASLAVTVPARAWTPIYSPRRIVHPADVHPGLVGGDISLTTVGSGGHLIGQVTYQTRSGSSIRYNSEAFVLAPTSQTPTNLNDQLQARSSTATYVSASGVVAGVYWTGVPPRIRQTGFLSYPDGTALDVRAPDDHDVVAITAFDENWNWVLGTYYDANGHQRAFVNDANGGSYDLGDPFDSQADFLWPQTISTEKVLQNNVLINVPVIWGTLYTPDPNNSLGGRVPHVFRSTFNADGTAFLMTPLGGTEGSIGKFLGCDSAGGAAVAGLVASSTIQGAYDPASFYWKMNQLTALGTLKGGVPVEAFAINPAGTITGTSVATSSRPPRLFAWQAATGLRDLGLAILSGGDQDTRLTGVSQGADRFAGTLLNGAGQPRVFVRTDGQTWDLEAVVPGSFGFALNQAATAARPSVFVNDAREVFCTGLFQGTPGVGVFTQDYDGNGLPDGWETQWFGHTGVDPNGDDDGDGTLNFQEYWAGTDPRDFYDGQVPTLGIVDGGDQRGAPGTVLPKAVVVGTGVGGKQNGWLHFTASGGALLSAQSGSGGTWAASLDLLTSDYVGGPGGAGWGARVYVKLPAGAGSTSTITASTASSATAVGGVRTSSVSTSATGTSAGLTPPTGLTLGANSATTMEVSWTPSDLSLGTVVEVSYDRGATWAAHSSYEPGTTAATLYRLLPDKHVSVRLYTAAPVPTGGGGGTNTNASSGTTASGGGSGVGAPGDRDTFSVPQVHGFQVSIDARNYSFAGFQDSRHRYKNYSCVQKQYSQATQGPGAYVCTFSGQVVPTDFSPTPRGGGYSGGTAIEFPGDLPGWNPTADDKANSANSYLEYPEAGVCSYHEVTYSGDYTLTEFCAAVEGVFNPISNEHCQFGSGTSAELHLQAPDPSAPPVGYRPKTIFGWDTSYDTKYQITKLFYTFKCNADPQGKVVYDIVFTPDDGSEVKHEVHVIPTNGRTEVGDPAHNNEPFTLDPLTLNNKAKGKYEVVPIDLQIDDWKDEDSQTNQEGQTSSNTAGTQPNSVNVDPAQQLGVIGNMVDSNKKGIVATPQRHFVTPQLNDSAPGLDKAFVRVRAQLPKDRSQNIKEYHWTLQADGGSIQEIPAEQKHFDVPRDHPSKYTVRLVPNDSEDDVGSINVWVVWAQVVATRTKSAFLKDVLVQTPSSNLERRGATIRAEWSFKATINPPSIVAPNDDRPDFNKPPKSQVPYSREISVTDGNPYGQPLKQWDISRRMRARVDSTTIGPAFMHEPPFSVHSKLFDNLPSSTRKIIVKTCPDPGVDGYPKNPLEGNDDSSYIEVTGSGIITKEDDDPYTNPDIGKLTDLDTPELPHVVHRDPPTFGEVEIELEFQEFCRLEIGGKWFLISNPALWRFDSRMKKTWLAIDDEDGDHMPSGSEGEMRDNLSISDGTNTSW